MACGKNRPVDVDAARGIFHDDHAEALTLCVLGREAHAKIESQPGNEHPLQSAFAQISCKTGVGIVVILVECLIGIYLAMIALAQNELGLSDIQFLSELGSWRALDTMVGP